MSSPGLIPGLNRDGWKRYEPKLITAGSGGETQPVLDSANYPFGNPSGRYLIADHNYVVVEIQLSFTGTYTIGTGSAYLLSLPFPANRWTGKGASSPVPLGLGMCYYSFVDPQVNEPTVVTLADPFASLNGTEDNYIQCYCQNILSWPAGGSDTLAAGSKTITHRLGFTPRADDIDVVFTNAAGIGTLDGAWYSIQNIGATTFDIKTGTTTAGHAPAFTYKVRANPPTGSSGPLMSPNTPWDWTRGTVFGPYGNIFIQCSYEPLF